MPKAMAGQASDHVCHIVVGLRKWHSVFWHTSSRTTFPFLTLYHSWYGDSSKQTCLLDSLRIGTQRNTHRVLVLLVQKSSMEINSWLNL